MQRYRNQLRIDVLTARGIVDVELLKNTKKATELDQKITRMAGRVLGKSEKTAFFFAYHCTPTWEDIQELFLSELQRDLELETVRKFANRAALALKNAAKTAPEFR